LLIVQTVTFDSVDLLKFSTKWDELLGNHWDQLSSILPVTNIVVDLVEESLTTNAEVFQVAETIVSGAITWVASIVTWLLPWAVSVWLENWWFVWFWFIIVTTIWSWLWWLWLVW